MTSIENFKSKMSDGLKSFFEKYEPHIKKLFYDLDSKGFLEKTSFTKEDIERLTDIATTSNIALGLINDFNRIIVSDEEKTKENLKKLGEAGWSEDKNRLGFQYYVVLSLTYHAYLERLKNYFITFIDWDAVGIDINKIYGIGTILKKLRSYFPNNYFLEYLDEEIKDRRNAIAHFTFYWKKGRIYFCHKLNDSSPTSQSTAEFMIEVHNVSALVEGFHLIYRDFLGMPPTDNFVN